MTLEEQAPDILNHDAEGDLILLCDHASNHVPEPLDQLGLQANHLEDHIAVDIGAAHVTDRMADMMGVAAVKATVSRLVIDVNRDLAHPGLIPPISDGVRIPGNEGLCELRTSARVSAYYNPFHSAATRIVQSHKRAGKTPFVAGIHSFTAEMEGFERPWHIGLMHNKDERLAQALIGILERETDLVIGDNQPYSGRDLFHTLETHGNAHGLHAVTVEIRNDLLQTPEHYDQWARLLANSFDELFSRGDLMGVEARSAIA